MTGLSSTQGEPPDWAALAPFPGSRLAVERGCKCPRMDNGHGDPGLARDRGGFVIVVGCPLHSPQPAYDKDRNGVKADTETRHTAPEQTLPTDTAVSCSGAAVDPDAAVTAPGSGKTPTHTEGEQHG